MRLVQVDEHIGKEPGENSQNTHQIEVYLHHAHSTPSQTFHSPSNHHPHLSPTSPQRQIGLLVGRTTSNKDYILETIVSPNQDGQSPIITSTRKPGSSLKLDSDWVIEHAAQVARLLPGGLAVQGLYFSCPEPLFSSSSQLIFRLLIAMKKELKSIVVIDNPLVLHIDSNSKKLTIKECPRSSNSSSSGASSSQLKPCEVKSLPLLSNFNSFQCLYNAQIQITIDNGNKRLRDAVKDAIIRETTHILGPALGFYNNNDCLADNNTPICDVIDNVDKGKVLEIQLIGPMAQAFPFTYGNSGGYKSSPKTSASTVPRSSMSINALGTLNIQGKLHCRAMVHKREPIGAAVEALKQDVKATLIARLDVLVEAADMTAADMNRGDENSNTGNTKDSAQIVPPSILSHFDELSGGVCMGLPRRVYLANNGSSNISYCDYLMEGEVEQHGVERMRELLGDGIVGQGCIVTSREKTKEMVGRGGVNSSIGGGGGMCSAALMAAVGVAVVAVGVGLSVGW
jgi:hypothetical protein